MEKKKKEIGNITLDDAIRDLAVEQGIEPSPLPKKERIVDKNDFTYRELTDIQSIETEIFTKRSLYGNEEATKQGLILPLLRLLDFDTANINEVYPEYPLNEGKAADYVMKVSGQISQVLEAKRLDRRLYRHIGQLESYYNEIGAKIGILSDGNHYLFFGDLENAGKMDTRPFLHIGLCHHFRGERVKVLLECYRLTHFDESYVSMKIKESDSMYLMDFSSMQRAISQLKLTPREKKGLAHYLPNLFKM